VGDKLYNPTLALPFIKGGNITKAPSSSLPRGRLGGVKFYNPTLAFPLKIRGGNNTKVLSSSPC
jgi:hypothetical protein